MGMVNVAPGSTGCGGNRRASDFFYVLLGPKNGQHARTAVGLAEPRTAFRSRSTGNLSFIREREVLGQALQRVILILRAAVCYLCLMAGSAIPFGEHTLAINASRYHRFARQ